MYDNTTDRDDTTTDPSDPVLASAYVPEELDDDMCCVICHEHVISDPHGYGCPSSSDRNGFDD